MKGEDYQIRKEIYKKVLERESFVTASEVQSYWEVKGERSDRHSVCHNKHSEGWCLYSLKGTQINESFPGL